MRQLGKAGAQEAECIWAYMSIPGTARRQITHAQQILVQV